MDAPGQRTNECDCYSACVSSFITPFLGMSPSDTLRVSSVIVAKRLGTRLSIWEVIFGA